MKVTKKLSGYCQIIASGYGIPFHMSIFPTLNLKMNKYESVYSNNYLGQPTYIKGLCQDNTPINLIAHKDGFVIFDSLSFEKE